MRYRRIDVLRTATWGSGRRRGCAAVVCLATLVVPVLGMCQHPGADGGPDAQVLPDRNAPQPAALGPALPGKAPPVDGFGASSGQRREGIDLPDRIAPPQLDFDAIEGYTHRRLEGWDLLVSDRLLQSEPETIRQALGLLAGQLRKVVDRLPPAVVQRLQKVPIWVSPRYPDQPPRAEYHPDRQWLERQGRPAEMAHCIEISNVDILAKECIRMPMLLLHELAHAYHHQVLGFDYAPIVQAFERAKQAGLYQRVRRGNGRMEKAYALTNHKEYFAECSEAFWGENDFFPFIRAQLERYDPTMAELLARVWREDELATDTDPQASGD